MPSLSTTEPSSSSSRYPKSFRSAKPPKVVVTAPHMRRTTGVEISRQVLGSRVSSYTVAALRVLACHSGRSPRGVGGTEIAPGFMGIQASVWVAEFVVVKGKRPT